MSTSSMPIGQENVRNHTHAQPESHLAVAVEHWLVSRLSERLEVLATALDRHQPLVRYGLDSIVALELVADLEDWLGCPLPLTLVWECPTIAAIVQHVEASVSQPLAPDDVGTPPAAVDALAGASARAGARTAETTGRLSYGQQAVWFIAQQAPESPVYNIARAVRIQPPLDVAALHMALQQLTERHAALRTTFPTAGGNPTQRVRAHLEVAFHEEDATTWSAAFLRHRLTQEASRPFDLELGPLFRVHLYTGPADEYILLLVMHHIVVDFWSLAVLVHELGILYRALTTGTAAALPSLTQDYTDYVRWQADMLDSAPGAQLWDYWQQQLAGELPILQLPTDRSRPPVQRYRGASQSLRLGSQLTQQLKTLSQDQDTTLYTTLLAAFYVLLYRYSGQEDLLVGSPMAGRNGHEWARLVGYLANPVPLRAYMSGNATFTALLAQVRRTVLGALAHQDYPLALLVERLQAARDASRSPLFQAMFVLQKAHRLDDQDLTPFALAQAGQQMEVGGLRLESLALDQHGALCDLTMTMAEVNGELTAALQYNTALFESQTISRMLGHFRTLLSGIVTDPQQRLATLPLLTAAEQQQLLVTWNDITVTYPHHGCLHETFAAQAARTPEAIAVTYGATQVSYGELNQRANQLAHYLQCLGVGPEVLVGLCVDRSVDMLVGMLGILKAGGAYVPLDPSYPQERLAFMLEDACVPVLLTQERLVPHLPACAAQVVCLDAAGSQLALYSEANPPSAVTAANLAYIMYTSGSTGTPKGVMVEHRQVLRLFAATHDWYHFAAQDVWTLFHSFAFDFSVWEIWGALLHGGRLVVVPFETSRTPEAFYELLSQEEVTVLNQTPSAFRQLIHAETRAAVSAKNLALRLVIFGGEALDLQSLRPWLERHGDTSPQLVNMYGITETTVHVTYRPLRLTDVQEAQGSPIGRPIPDLQVYVLDQYQQPVPVGVPGELYVGGAGVARGYFNRAELTAARFIADPYNATPGARLYRSGDAARYLSDGQLEYLGRLDQQVKIRGFRVELGEIEAALAQHAALRQVLVVAHEETPNNRRLVAYVVPEQQPAPSHSALYRFLKDKLPDYMIPAAFVVLEALPLTAHGKIDRQALPAPTPARPHGERAYMAPRTPTEQTLTNIWQEVLGIERVGVQDNFFELGGDSIRSIQVQARAQAHGLGFPVQTLFRYQTIDELAPLLSHAAAQPATQCPTPASQVLAAVDRSQLPEDVEDAYPLTLLQTAMLTYSQQHPDSNIYHDIFSYHLRARFDAEALLTAVQRLTVRHAILRTACALTDFSAPLQLVYGTARIPCRVEDWQQLSAAQQDTALQAWIEAEKHRPFDLARPPLLRLQIHRRTPDTFQLTLSFHHAILDGWSVASMLTELFQHYTALLDAGSPLETPPLLCTFRDFVALERQALDSKACQRYWHEQWPDHASTALQPCPVASKAPATPYSADVEVPLAPQVYTGLQRFAHTAGVPLKSVLLAAHLKVLSLLSGTTEVLTGVVSHGRPEKPDAEKALGLFLNVLPFRLQCGDIAWRDLVQQAFAREQQQLPFRHYPVAHMPRVGSSQPQFDTVFNFVHFRVFKALEDLPHLSYLGGTFSDPFPYTLKANFILHPFTSTLMLSLNYNRHVLCDEQIQAIGRYYHRVLSNIATAPDRLETWLEDAATLEQEHSTTASATRLCMHLAAECDAVVGAHATNT